MFQCKVGSDPEESEKCIRACAEVLDSSDILMVDPNTGTTDLTYVWNLPLHKYHIKLWTHVKNNNLVNNEICAKFNWPPGVWNSM